MSEQHDYLNPHKIYTDRVDIPPGFDSASVGASETENTTEPLPFEPDEDEDEYKPVIYPPRTSCGLLEED